MGTPFLGELRLFPYANTPNGWARCNGQLLPINSNQALFALLGTQYGGDGQTSFALPNLQGRVAMHPGDGFFNGQAFGAVAHTLIQSELPAHTHLFQANTANADKDLAFTPPAATLGAFNNAYRDPTNLTTLHPSTVGNVGGSQPHENRQPYLVLIYNIALQGIFPSRN